MLNYGMLKMLKMEIIIGRKDFSGVKRSGPSK